MILQFTEGCLFCKLVQVTCKASLYVAAQLSLRPAGRAGLLAHPTAAASVIALVMYMLYHM